MLIKKVGIKMYVFGKLFRTTVVSMKTRSYYQLKFLKLVTKVTIKICIKAVFDTYNEGGNRNIGFCDNYLGQLGFPWQYNHTISLNS